MHYVPRTLADIRVGDRIVTRRIGTRSVTYATPLTVMYTQTLTDGTVYHIECQSVADLKSDSQFVYLVRDYPLCVQLPEGI